MSQLVNLRSCPPDRFDVEPIIGWRAWITDSSGTLLSTVKWPTGHRAWPSFQRREAACAAWKQPDHEVPWLGCTCGTWAWKYGVAAAFVMKEWIDTGITANGVYGQVSLWGTVLEFSEGYRAKYAYPRMLRTTNASVASKLIENYGVEVEVI